MRLELALIVGILFFCSWCAYIVARMNSSVNVGTSAGTVAAATSSLPVASLNSQGDYTADGGAGATLIGHASLRGEHQARLFGASEPIPSAQFTPSNGLHSAGRNWPPYVSSSGGGGGGGGHVNAASGNYSAHAAGASSAQPPHGLQQWQSFALPSHAAGASAPAYASQSPTLLDYSGGQQSSPTVEEDAGQEEEEAEGPVEEGGVADYPQTAASSGEVPVEGEEEEEEADVEQSPQTELEEVANRRSFDELQSDSSERDKDGQVVVTKRRHLINGRPVAAKPSQVIVRAATDDDQGPGEGQDAEEEEEEEEAGSTAASSRVPHESALGAGEQSEADFEQLVDEIDQEDKLRKKAATIKPEVIDSRAGVAAAQSRPRGIKLAPAGATRDLIGRRSDPDTPSSEPPRVGSLPAAATATTAGQSQLGAQQQQQQQEAAKTSNENNDSHEHSLQESLQAQQWDDDSATSGGAAIAPEAAPEIGNEEDQEEVSNIVERDHEARRLAQMSHDLLLSPERVSRELDQEQDENEDQEQEQERRRRRRRKRETIIRSSVPSTLSLSLLGNLGSLAAVAAAPVPAVANETSPTKDLSREESTGMGAEVHDGTTTTTTTNERKVRLRTPPISLPRPDGRQLFEEAPAASSGPAREQVVSSSNTSPSMASNNNATKDNAALISTARANDRPGDLLSLHLQDGGHLRRLENSANSGQLMSGLEDMRVEVLADPPPPRPPPFATSSGGAPLDGHAHQSGPQLASGSDKIKSQAKGVTKQKKRKKKYKKASKSKMVDGKYKAARAYARKHASRNKKGQMRKKRRKSEKKLVARKKHFKGATRGNKFAHGAGAHGAKKGANFYKDKGYKKRGFKKAYHKLETGDHKTYFDEFRDKDHHKKWKNFNDKHKYAQKKKWAGSDSRHLDQHKLKLAKARASKAGKWRESAANRHVNELDKYKKYKKSSSKSKAVKSSSATKKKKKKKKVVTKKE